MMKRSLKWSVVALFVLHSQKWLCHADIRSARFCLLAGLKPGLYMRTTKASDEEPRA
jgi:hypothetical protein